jgi:endonuclease/exonuclease/phosphatase family metal-dependent hydrolase
MSRATYVSGMRWLLLILVLVFIFRCRDDEPKQLRIATFNIENFPKSAKQVAGAFAEIAALDAPIVAVQEITNPTVFESAMQRRLGPAWRFEYVETGSVLDHRIGVLYDSRVVKHVKTRVHTGTALEGQQKPVLDVELSHRGQHIRVLVLHLKAGGENHPIRTRQYAALKKIIAEVRKAKQPIVLLGDFNATGEADREDLGALDLRWLTQPLECTAFWDRDDGCPRSRLDHVLSTQPASTVRATGACATEGCARQDSCPLYAHEVSDHCPVVVDISY